MNGLDELIRLLLDDPELLTDEQLQTLATEVRRQPAMAIGLKDHLIVAESLSRTFAESRQRFVDQVNRRLRSETGSAAETNSHATTPTDTPANTPNVNSSGRRTLVVFTLFAIVWAILLGWLETTPWANKVAFVESVRGPAFLDRNARGVRLVVGMPLVAGDRIETLEDSTAAIEFPDRSRFELSASSIASLPDETNTDERILLRRGEFSVTMRSGKTVRESQCATPFARLTGSAAGLVVEHDSTRTIVRVEEGRVRVAPYDSNDAGYELVSGQIATVDPRGVKIASGPWPSNPDSVVFLLPPDAADSFTPEQGLQVFATGPAGPLTLRPRRNARFDETGRFVFENGAFLADRSAGEAISRAVQASRSVAIEMTIQPDEITSDVAGTVLAFSDDDGSTRMAIRQQEDTLGIDISDSPAETRFLYQFTDNEPHHLVILVSPERLRCFVDGKLTADHQDVRIDLTRWPAEFLILGNDWLGENPWRGTLEGLAIYSRVLTDEEIRRNGLHYRLRRQPLRGPEYD